MLCPVLWQNCRSLSSWTAKFTKDRRSCLAMGGTQTAGFTSTVQPHTQVLVITWDTIRTPNGVAVSQTRPYSSGTTLSYFRDNLRDFHLVNATHCVITPCYSRATLKHSYTTCTVPGLAFPPEITSVLSYLYLSALLLSMWHFPTVHFLRPSASRNRISCFRCDGDTDEPQDRAGNLHEAPPRPQSLWEHQPLNSGERETGKLSVHAD